MADNRIRPKGKNPANEESELFKRTERPRPKADFFLDLLIICFF